MQPTGKPPGRCFVRMNPKSEDLPEMYLANRFSEGEMMFFLLPKHIFLHQTKEENK